ncbi:hypothetical protein GTN42_00675 [bacterium]|nr:hypothetical protein [bacterium]
MRKSNRERTGKYTDVTAVWLSIKKILSHLSPTGLMHIFAYVMILLLDLKLCKNWHIPALFKYLFRLIMALSTHAGGMSIVSGPQVGHVAQNANA